MCDRIRHRGPDDAGYHASGPAAIGMRRLSIVDLHTGHQPISNEDGSIWVVFNGEIYNYRELRRDLIARGHRFRTNSDTETLVHLYEDEGVAGIGKLRGMFAYALWDGRDGSLTLVRDRFGKKPLYYCASKEGLLFGSELACLRAAGAPSEIDEEAIRLYLQFGFIPDPLSPYRAVRKLPAGGWMRCHADGRLEHGLYWRLPVPAGRAEAGFTPDSARRQIREVFDESVRLRMAADVPLGAFLSGGIDSSSIVASMALQSNDPVKTFSIGFEEATYSELPYAEMLAKRYGTEHHAIVVKPDSIDLMEKTVRHCGEPFADEACIPTHIVSEFARKHVKVVLTGDGGDELFGGYECFFRAQSMAWADRIPHPARWAVSRLADALPYSAYGKNLLRAISRSTALDRYFEMNSAPYFLRERLLNPAWMLPADGEYLRKAFAESLLTAGSDILTQALYFEATAKLTGVMLVKVDRMSMANSIEVRCPLLDHELAAVAARIPHAWKMSGGSGKRIFIDAMRDRLPAELIDRKKMGFGFPLAVWFRGALHDFLRDHLTGQTFRMRGIATPAFVETLLAEHRSGRRDNSHWLYLLLMLELWFRQHDSATAAHACPAEETASWPTR